MSLKLAFDDMTVTGLRQLAMRNQYHMIRPSMENVKHWDEFYYLCLARLDGDLFKGFPYLNP